MRWAALPRNHIYRAVRGGRSVATRAVRRVIDPAEMLTGGARRAEVRTADFITVNEKKIQARLARAAAAANHQVSVG